MSLDQVANVHPVNELEDDVMDSPILADVVHAGDVVVIEARGGLGFVAKAAQRFVVGRLVARQNLDGHLAIERGVQRAKYNAHPPATNELLQQELAELFAFDKASRVKWRRPAGKRRA